ncbi:uncharacterized protein PV09_05992 [Verruconis gallopava]|uniref:FAD-binding domain-containing protein n=1 Tax=Verruconis gallopava TaxID=253628 RepID=A0A0D2ATU7_9PEZI|nr:uncharacterized protein PV09_05992 [Verruconis gallopava]KIW02534.1 hypothetical protein PV09_05992 [Verruconis gallopava]
MEHTEVVIVGAGPSGLSLGLTLAQFKIQSIILEKEAKVTEDPRGVYLAQDAIRILHNIGIGDRMKEIGHVVPSVNYHRTALASPPFLKMYPNDDSFCQTVPDGILQVQTKLEQVLRELIAESPYCSLRLRCEVVDRVEEDDRVIINYIENSDSERQIQCCWLVGADGKKGTVRKRFLEPEVGIVQETGILPYEGTWIAANLKITLPTKSSHPDFPLWKLGYTPSDVYDLFWPEGWHFCSPPGTPVACGRFGPYEDRLWRHEIEVLDWNDSMDPHKMMIEHLKGMMTRSISTAGQPEVQFPFDCIKILRCRPFKFAHKVVNRWFHNRTILIGDAAHVFPPFGGQGIACGIRDAHGLAWRLALILRLSKTPNYLAEDLLMRWSLERQQGVYDSMRYTMSSGILVNGEDRFPFSTLRRMVSIMNSTPFMSGIAMRESVSTDRSGYRHMNNGFYLPEMNGGRRLAQVYMVSNHCDPFLSDKLLLQQTSIFTLFVIDSNPEKHLSGVKYIIETAGLNPAILSESSICLIDNGTRASVDSRADDLVSDKIMRVASLQELHGKDLLRFYTGQSFVRRIGQNTKFVIARPDFIIFAAMDSYSALKDSVDKLHHRLCRL